MTRFKCTEKYLFDEFSDITDIQWLYGDQIDRINSSD